MRKLDLTKDHLFPHGDDFFQALIAAHEGLSRDESEALNARMILLMANQIGDLTILNQLIDASREGLEEAS